MESSQFFSRNRTFLVRDVLAKFRDWPNRIGSSLGMKVVRRKYSSVSPPFRSRSLAVKTSHFLISAARVTGEKLFITIRGNK